MSSWKRAGSTPRPGRMWRPCGGGCWTAHRRSRWPPWVGPPPPPPSVRVTSSPVPPKGPDPVDDGVRYSRLAWRVYEAGASVWNRTRLRAVHMAGLPGPDLIHDGTPLLVVANHVSWWDGFL